VKRGLPLAAAALAIAAGASSGQAAPSSLIVFSADRAPSLSGEIYRVDPNGRVVDLSNSPYQDVDPAVSPDGRRVAFLSDRSGAEGIYEVGIDGRGLVRVAPSLQVTCAYFPGGAECPELAWQPHGSRLATGWSGSGTGGVWIVRRVGAPLHLDSATVVDGWSPDGRALAVDRYIRQSESDRELVVSPRGHTLWSVGNVASGSATWSARNALAITTGGGRDGARHAVAVYDEKGRLRFRERFGTAEVWPTWSPNGTRLAVASGHMLVVRAATGRVLLRRKLQQALGWGDVGWVGDDRLVLAVGTGVRMVDLRTGRVRPASKRFLGFTSPGGALAVHFRPRKGGFALQVERTAGGPAKTYTHVPGCSQDGGWSAGIGSLAFVPSSRSLVYASACTSPYPGLYSVPASGGTPRLITQDPRESHTSPALSPDGTKIAYSTQCNSHLCGGPGAIDVASMEGQERAVTSATKCGADESPTWSPDGTTILFTRFGCNELPELCTVPASGAPAVRPLGVSGTQPAWGPSRIAFVSSGIWTANPDGSDPVHVAGGNDFSPAWSASGQLAYLTITAAGTALVVGTKQTFLPFAHVSSLAWSPDGSRLVITAATTQTAPFDVYTIRPDGTDPVRLTTDYDALSVTG